MSGLTRVAPFAVLLLGGAFTGAALGPGPLAMAAESPTLAGERASAAPPGSLTAAAARGKIIYTTGASPRGTDPVARIAGELELPATLYPCLQCHKADGRGGLEGGVMVPEIRWARLTAPYGVPTWLGGVRPSYDEASAARAIHDGLDAAGEPLDPLMPRYALGEADLADLVAYLKVLGSENPPGVDGETIRIASLLPLSGPLGGGGRAIGSFLGSYFEQRGASATVNGRSVEHVAVDVGTSAVAARAAVEELLDGPDPVFCFLANAGPGADPQVLRLLSDRGVPVVGPLTFEPVSGSHGSVFYVLPSFEDQGRAAATFLAERLEREGRGERAVALVRGPGSAAQAMASGFAMQARRLGLRPAEERLAAQSQSTELGASAEGIGQLRRTGARDLVVFGSRGDLELVLDEAARRRWVPRLLTSSVLLGGGPGPLEASAWMVAPPLVAAGARFDSLLARASVPGAAQAEGRVDGRGQRAMQMAAFAAAELLTDALMRAGRAVSRERLLSVLRDVRGFATGVTPELEFGPNRRLGVRGALIVEVDATRGIVGRRFVDGFDLDGFD